MAKRVAEAVLPASVVVWRGREVHEPLGAQRGKGRVALTFDDGPTSLTRGYLDCLARVGARATFFVVGAECERHPELVRAISDAGHQLAGHGFTHRRFPSLSDTELGIELGLTAAMLPSTGGRPLVRPPHGAVSPSSLLTCTRAGFTTALWSFDSGDSRTDRAEAVLAAFENGDGAPPGSVVLLHEGQGWTLDALPAILDGFGREGRELVTMGELLDG
jgi:peptidoglycan/xylan/chitin deacetylase (PgdA/CDA1 family)